MDVHFTYNSNNISTFLTNISCQSEMQTQCQMNIFALLKCRMHKKSYAPLFRCFRFVSFLFTLLLDVYGLVRFGSIHFDMNQFDVYN